MNIAAGLVRLYRGETTVDYYGKRKPALAVSGVFLVATVVVLLLGGLNLGIDFRGGVAWESPVTATLDQDAVREVLEANGVETSNAKVQTLQGADGERIRVQVGDQSDEVRAAVQKALAEKAGLESQDVSVAAVSSSWGRSITVKAIRALLVFFVLVSLYIAWRFEWKMALAAIIAMAHDVLISVGIYAMFRFEVTPATVVAFLTILGYSLYDTVVVFDKIKENEPSLGQIKGETYSDMANRSLNQVLMRSINTSFVAILPVASLLVVGVWIMGAITLRDFGLALFVGLLSGAYSSVFVAAPVLTWWKEREPRNRNLAERAAARPQRVAAVPTGGDVSLDSIPAATVTPKPRKPRKRR